MPSTQIWPPRELPRPFAAYPAGDQVVGPVWEDLDGWLAPELLSATDFEFNQATGVLTFRRRLFIDFSYGVDFYVASGNQDSNVEARLMVDDGQGGGWQEPVGTRKSIFIPRGAAGDANAVYGRFLADIAEENYKVKIQVQHISGNTTVMVGADGTAMQCIAWRY